MKAAYLEAEITVYQIYNLKNNQLNQGNNGLT